MIFFKHKLRKKLPYYRITRSAKRRLDDIAAALPARGDARPVAPPAAVTPKDAPRHFKPEPTVPQRERPFAAFLRVATCALVCIAFVGVSAALLLLRSSAPAQPPAASVLPTPTATPKPAYTMEIENAETRGGCAFFDIVLTFSEAEQRRAAFYTTDLNAPEGVQNTALSIEGREAKLDGSPVFIRDAATSRYRASVSAKLPEPLLGGALKAELTISALYGMKESGDRNAPLTQPDIALNAVCTQSFVFTAAQRLEKVVGAENGIKLSSVSYDDWGDGTCTVQVDYPYMEGVEPYLHLDFDGESLPVRIENEPWSGMPELADILYTFGEIPPDTQRMTLQVFFPYLNDEKKTMSSATDPAAQLAAEFTLYPQEDRFERKTDSAQLADIEQITANARRQPLFYTDHTYLPYSEGGHYKWGADEPLFPSLTFYLDTDLPWALPLECWVVATNGEVVTFPLYGETPDADGLVSGEGYSYSVETYQFQGMTHRGYSATVTFGEDLEFWDNNDVTLTITNTVSGRVLAASTIERYPTGQWGSGADDPSSEVPEDAPEAGSPEASPEPEPSPTPEASESQPTEEAPPPESQPDAEAVSSTPVSASGERPHGENGRPH